MAHLNDTQRLSDGFLQAEAGVWRTLRGLGQRVRLGVQRLQQARMAAVLANMSDAQLDAIGITRREILDHAAHLVGLDQDAT